MNDDGINWWNEESVRKRKKTERTHTHAWVRVLPLNHFWVTLNVSF